MFYAHWHLFNIIPIKQTNIMTKFKNYSILALILLGFMGLIALTTTPWGVFEITVNIVGAFVALILYGWLSNKNK